MRTLLMALPVLALAACDSKQSGEQEGGTQISIKGDSGNFNAGIDKDGRVAIDVPGLKGSIALPKINIDAGDFAINGVGLPNGSKVDTLNVNGEGQEEKMQIAFTSPMGAADVRQWFQGKLSAEGFTLKSDGTGLSGTTDDGKPFRLTTRDAGGGRTQSEIAIGR